MAIPRVARTRIGSSLLILAVAVFLFLYNTTAVEEYSWQEPIMGIVGYNSNGQPIMGIIGYDTQYSYSYPTVYPFRGLGILILLALGAYHFYIRHLKTPETF